MKPISQYTDIAIRRDTQNVLFWIVKVQEHLKRGDGHLAHSSLAEALKNCLYLCEKQKIIEDCEQPNWEQIYNACLDGAQEEVKQTLKEWGY